MINLTANYGHFRATMQQKLPCEENSIAQPARLRHAISCVRLHALLVGWRQAILSPSSSLVVKEITHLGFSLIICQLMFVVLLLFKFYNICHSFNLLHFVDHKVVKVRVICSGGGNNRQVPFPIMFLKYFKKRLPDTNKEGNLTAAC